MGTFWVVATIYIVTYPSDFYSRSHYKFWMDIGGRRPAPVQSGRMVRRVRARGDQDGELRHGLPGCTNPRRDRRAMDPHDSARPLHQGRPQIPGLRDVVSVDQPE